MAAEPPANVGVAHQAYKAQHQDLQGEELRALQTLRESHLDESRPLFDRATERGDFERAAAVWDLQKLIKGEPTEEWLDHDHVKKSVAKWRAAEARLETTFEQRENEIRKGLIRALEGTVSDLVKQERIDEAIAVRNMSKQVEKTPPKTPVKLTWILPGSENGQAVADQKTREPGAGATTWSEDTLLYLGFENKPETDVFFDDGPKKHRCTLHGDPTFEAGKKGQALRLDKIGEYIDVKPFTLGPGITMAGWVKYDRDCAWGHVLKMADPEKRGELAIFCDDTGRNLMTTLSARGPDKSDLKAMSTAKPKQWIHIISTCDRAGNVVLYKNGRQVNSLRRKNGISSHPRTYVRIGRDFNHAGVPSNFGVYGVVDEIVVLNRALEKNEIDPFFRYYGGTQESPQ